MTTATDDWRGFSPCEFRDAKGQVCGKPNGADVHYHGKGPACDGAPNLRCHEWQTQHRPARRGWGMSWKAGPEKPRLPFCWHCSRRFHGRVFARIVGADGHEHDVHKQCVRGRQVVTQSTTVRP